MVRADRSVMFDIRDLDARIDLCGAGLSRCRRDVVIYAEEIGRIVLLLDHSQAGEVCAEGCLDDFLGFNIERRRQVRVGGVRPQGIFTAPSPITVDRGLKRIGPLSAE